MDDLDRMFRRLVQNIRTGYPDYLSRPFEVSELYQNIIPYRHNRSELGLEQNQDYEFALMRLLGGERGYLVVDETLRDEMQRELASPNPDTSAFRAFSTAQVSLSAEAVRRLDQYLAGGTRPDDARLGRTAPRAPGIQPPPPPPRPAAPPAMPAPGVAASAPTVQMSGHGGMEPALDAYPPPPPRAPERAVPPPPPPRPEPRYEPRLERSESRPESRPEARPEPRPEPRAEPRAEAPAARQAAPAAGAAMGAGIHEGGACRYCGGTLPTGRAVTFCPHCGQNLTIRQCPACSSEIEVGWRFCVTCGRGVES